MADEVEYDPVYAAYILEREQANRDALIAKAEKAQAQVESLTAAIPEAEAKVAEAEAIVAAVVPADPGPIVEVAADVAAAEGGVN